MPHLTTLRSLVPSSSFSLFLRNPSLSSPFLLLRPNKPFSLLTPLASSNPPRRRRFTPQRRNTSTFSIVDKKAEKKQLGRESETPSMEDSNPSDSVAAFNRKRAEGRDKEDLPRKSLQLKVRKLNPINTISYVQILGTGMDTQDTSPSVLLFFDKQRFIFNAGEGLQRFCTEHKIKLSKIDHIFLSRVCSETAGGLPGLLLTLAGMGDEGMLVNVWGPSDLKYLVDAMKCFIPNAAMVHTRSFGPSLDSDRTAMTEHSKLKGPIVLIDDEVVKISAILLQPSFSEGYNFVKETPLEHSGSGPSSPNRKISSSAKPGDMSVVYVCELPEIKGKFDPRKASSLGLRPGPKYRELQLGNSVKSDREDIMIHPSDVMGPSIPGPVVFLIDCPTASHLQELLSVEYLNRYCPDFSDPLESSKVVSCIIHLSPASVVSRSDYQNWMKRFGSSSTQHIMAGHERKNVEIPILKASARIAARLNYLCPQFFPAPGFWSLKNLGCLAPNSIIPNEVCDKDSDLKLCESLYAENLLKFTLRPYANLGLDKSGVPSLMARTDVIDELLTEIPDIGIAAQDVSQLWGASSGTGGEISPSQDVTDMVEEPWLNEKTLPSCLENVRRDDLEIVLLGTGSSQPSKYRNVSSIHINLFSKGGLLLDCGEGTLGQLKRRYGVEGADEAVKGLRCIWISHIHADHHTGLARILALRHDLLKGEPHEPVLVVGPIQLKRFLDAYQRLEDLDMQFLDCRETLEDTTDKNINGQIAQKIDSTLFAKGSRMQSYLKKPGSPIDNSAAMKSLEKVLADAGLEALFSFPVVHCSQAYGVMLKAAERVNCVGKVIPGWKVVYSGDTRPCPTLVQASRGATILIHEATFEEGMVEEAIAKNHSTTEEAIDVGNTANAYRIILTHFSQRYPKIPVFDDRHMNNTCIAFDMMSVNLADLPVLPRVLPYLKLLFRNEMVFDESDDVREAINV